MGMHHRVIIHSILTLLLSACQPIVIHVGQASKRAEYEPTIPYRSSADDQSYSTWNSIQDYLDHLNAIKQMGKDALLKRYHQDGRQRIRGMFRHFRQKLEADSNRLPSDTASSFAELQVGSCMPFPTQDIFNLSDYGDLRGLLETVFLSKIKPTSAPALDPETPADVDAVSKLGFFELGISMDGASAFEINGAKEKQSSDLRWKVIHEQIEPESWIADDDQGVRFSFQKTHEAPAQDSFTLLARVGPQVYEEGDLGSMATLAIDYQRIVAAAGQSLQTMILRAGQRDQDAVWQQLSLSRRISVSQNIAEGRILHLVEQEHFGEWNESARSFRLDMDQQSLCADLMDEGGAGWLTHPANVAVVRRKAP